jgi:hypothetical protein
MPLCPAQNVLPDIALVLIVDIEEGGITAEVE